MSTVPGSVPAETHESTSSGIHIDRYEKAWLGFAVAMLVIFAAAVTTSAFVIGIQLPAPVARIDPKLVATPGATLFGEPGVRELAPQHLEARVLARTWQFEPKEIRVKAGDKVTFFFTSQDVIHGVKLVGTNVNMMVIPGQVSRLSATIDKPGTYKFICHEYCGIAHHTMYGEVIVEP
jgi:cytochrome c oxidase subunit 2